MFFISITKVGWCNHFAWNFDMNRSKYQQWERETLISDIYFVASFSLYLSIYPSISLFALLLIGHSCRAFMFYRQPTLSAHCLLSLYLNKTPQRTSSFCTIHCSSRIYPAIYIPCICMARRRLCKSICLVLNAVVYPLQRGSSVTARAW